MPKTVITDCKQCKKGTNHLILFSKKVLSSFFQDDDNPTFEEYMTVQCKGCDTLSFLLRNSGGVYTEEDGTPYNVDENYPPIKFAQDFNLLNEEDVYELPSLLRMLYQEVQVVFDNDANILAGIGLRMLVEAICLEQNIQGSNLKIKIEQLHINGLISKNEAPILDKLREIGNTSAHEIKGFSLEMLSYALDIINHILTSIYILPKINKRLKIGVVKKKVQVQK